MNNKTWKQMRDEWLAQERSAECKEREARLERGRQQFAEMMRDLHSKATTEQCPCCNGTGRLGIIIGAKDDA